MSPTTHQVLPYIVVHDEDKNFEESIQGELMDWMDAYSLKHKGNNRSNVNGYQSPDDFYKEPSFDKFLSYMENRIDTMIESYREHEYVSWDNQYKLSNMWFNINYTGCYNAQHTHPGCPLAGVLWIDIPQNSGEFTFHHHDSHSLAELQVTTWSYEPDPGLMMLFPGSLAHHVDENRSREPRYSIAFNLYDKF
tara:strand:- start:563 stop:1141 length:579 start_codon:yes stop_codon:yes gene_type:complete